MDALKLAHLALLFTWGGLILAETVVEALGLDAQGQAFATRAHFWIDVLLELPIVGCVLATGAVLTARAWPPSPLLWVKIGAALLAITVNLYCGVLVALRYRRRADPLAVGRLARRIRVTGAAVPAGVFALYVGLRYFA